jgi:hypothetical protein
MSLSQLDRLQQRFTQFWGFAEREAAERQTTLKPLAHVKENWEDWWDSELASAERAELQQLMGVIGRNEAAQQSFVDWVAEWIAERYQRRGAGRWALAQLTQLPLFQLWKCLIPYRPENLCGPNAIILRQPRGGSKEDIQPLALFVIPKEATDHLYHLVNLETNHAPRRDAWEATLSLLNGFAFWALLLSWGLWGCKPRRPRIRTLQWIGWTLTPGILLFLFFTAPFAYFADDQVLTLILGALVIIPSLLLMYALGASVREGLGAWRSGKIWAEMLRQSHLCLLIGGAGARQPLQVKGPSFGVELCLGILLALHEEAPVTVQQSWLWRRFFDQLNQKLPGWNGTGEVTASGFIKQVNRLDDKIAASLDHPDITDMILPAQDEAHPRTVRRSGPELSTANCIGQAAGASELRLHRCRHLVKVILTMGNLVNRWSIFGFIVKLALVVLLGFAMTDIISLLRPPSLQPEWVEEAQRNKGYRCYFSPDGRPEELRLDFRASEPDAFLIVVTSEYYRNRAVELDTNKKEGLDSVVAHVPLEEHPAAVGPARGEIEVRYIRKFLGRRLPDGVIFRGPLPAC